MGLLPFFTFYGGKHRASRHYPPPRHDVIVEPFAGSAGYSVNYPDRQVILRDLDPIIVTTWRYLIGASAEEILALPDLAPGQSTAELEVPEGAGYLIGWWLNKGSAQPKRHASTFMLNHPRGGPYWGPRVRERIAAQLPAIRHWQVQQGSYEDAPDVAATWFIDPPYQRTGNYTYRCGSKGIDYAGLARWCTGRTGQVIVCEADDADWLPFEPLVPMRGTEGWQKQPPARMEVVYRR